MNGAEPIALITVTYNGAGHLPAFLESLASQSDRSWRLFVVDNASDDASVRTVHEWSGTHALSSEVIVNAVNVGVAHANNQGVLAARAAGFQQVLLLNNDVTFDASFLARARASIGASAAEVWSCLARLPDQRTRWYGGGVLDYWRASGRHLSEAESGDIDRRTNVTYAPTSMLFVRVSVFDRIGLFDARFFAYYDDTDFCRRLEDAGIPICYDPMVSYVHLVGQSSGGTFSPFSVVMATRNKLLYITKHYRGLALVGVLGMTMLLRVWQIMVRRDRRHIIRGVTAFFQLRQDERRGGMPSGH